LPRFNIVLSLEIIHRGSLAPLGATIIVSAAIGFGALQSEALHEL
jgi:hypothetical protein